MEAILSLIKTAISYIVNNPSGTVLWFIAILGAVGGIPAVIQVVDRLVAKSRPILITPIGNASCEWDNQRREYLIRLEANIIERTQFDWVHNIQFHWLKESYPLLDAKKSEEQLGKRGHILLTFQTEMYDFNDLPDEFKKGTAKGYVYVGKHTKTRAVKIIYVGTIGYDSDIIVNGAR